MKLKLATLMAMSVMSIGTGAAHAANSHLGVIPLENMFDVSFRRIDANGTVKRTLREAGAVVTTYQNIHNCFLLSRTFVITDAQLNVFVQDPASPIKSNPMIYAVNGANPEIPLAVGDWSSLEPGDMRQVEQNLTGGVVMPGNSQICMSGPASAQHNWFEGRVSGYYPTK